MSWTKVRIEALSSTELRQLRANAETRGNHEIVALCDEVLRARPKVRAKGKAKRQHELDGRPLVSRSKAFEMRGVKLRNIHWSWGGVRPTDGVVVFTLWSNEIESVGDTNRYLLYGPNRDGDRPWADTLGGRERLEHCRAALAKGEAEGLLIYGQTSGGDLPIEEASRVTGADPHTVLRFQVRQDGDEYWAVWSTTNPQTKTSA